MEKILNCLAKSCTHLLTIIIVVVVVFVANKNICIYSMCTKCMIFSFIALIHYNEDDDDAALHIFVFLHVCCSNR